MRIGINKDAARHVDAYVNEHNRQKMDKLIQEKGLQGKKGPIGFMDLLPKEETYGYQIEAENRKGRKQLGYEEEEDSPLEKMNGQINRDNQISRYKFGQQGPGQSLEAATESVTALELFTTPHNFKKIMKPLAGAGLSATGLGRTAPKPVGYGSGMKSTAASAATRKKF